MKYLIAVGACYLDTILSVPYYPGEDEKLRATTLTKRRGGNCPNTIEVLQQLVCASTGSNFDSSAEFGHRPTSQSETQKRQQLQLLLSSVLPSESSASHNLIARSFDSAIVDTTSHSICREGNEEAASSYIIKSQSTSSRTIVNYNDLPEMTVDEFKQLVDAYLYSQRKLKHQSSGNSESMNQTDEDSIFWYHFEGRIPPTILSCIKSLRAHEFFQKNSATLKISVEVEKPNRPGLTDLAGVADVVFYSKSWATAQGYNNAEACLLDQAQQLPQAELLICTWGDEGAVALSPTDEASTGTMISNTPGHNDNSAYVKVPAFKPTDGIQQSVSGTNQDTVVDTIGAGDTFIAGMLWALLCWSDSSSLDQKLAFANELAGRKVMQEGFDGLGEIMKEVGWL